MKWINRQIKEPPKDAEAILVWCEYKNGFACVCLVYYSEGWTEAWTGETVDFRYWQPLPKSPYEEDA